MARFGRFSDSQIRQLQRDLNRLQGPDLDTFIEDCAKELAARLLASVVRRTPTGVYPSGSGKTGGTLRRGWTDGRRASARGYSGALTVRHFWDTYVIEIVNPVEYASYVEYGHRTVNHSGWVPGRFMMTISEQEIQSAAPGIIKNKIQRFLSGCLR